METAQIALRPFLSRGIADTFNSSTDLRLGFGKKKLPFFDDFQQFSAWNSAISQPISLKLAPNNILQQLFKISARSAKVGPISELGYLTKECPIDIYWFSAVFGIYPSGIPQPILLKLEHISTISPNIPLKFQPDRLRWSRAASQAVRRKSAGNRSFCRFVAVFGPKHGHISTVLDDFINMHARTLPDDCLKISAWSVTGLLLVWSVTDRQTWTVQSPPRDQISHLDHPREVR